MNSKIKTINKALFNLNWTCNYKSWDENIGPWIL